MTHPPLKTLTASRSPKGGFTLVEILVVIAIIALLAGVALPAVTGALKKAKESAALQQGHGLALACFQFSVDNDGTFPGALPNATPAVVVGSSTDAFKLLAGSYVSNTDSFFITMPGKTKYAGNAPTTGLAAANVCWDYTVGPADVGLTTSDPDQTPLLMSTGSTVTYGAVGGAPAAATATLAANGVGDPFTVDGIAVAYKDMSSAFKTPNAGAAAAFPISSVSFAPLQTYTQLTP